MTHATPEQVRTQFFKTLHTFTSGSESMRRECEGLYQLGRRDLATVSRLPLFNNREQELKENSRGR